MARPKMSDAQASLATIIFFIIFSVILFTQVGSEILFNKSKIKFINTIEDIASLKNTNYAKIDLPLEIEKSIKYKNMIDRHLIIVPFSNTSYSLFYLLDGEFNIKNQSSYKPPFEGRIVSKNIFGEWSYDTKSIDFKGDFWSDFKINIPANAKILYIDKQEKVTLWEYFLVLMSILIFLLCLIKLPKTIIKLIKKT